jgi:hypothetical protein
MHNAILIYAILCLVVGYLGRRTRLGFLRSFLLSFLLTPMVIFVYLLLFASLTGSEKDQGL